MNILVTGSAGFIGFHVALRLLEEGHQVTGVDSFTPYYQVELKRRRHAVLEQASGFTGLDLDVCNVAELQKLFKDRGFSVVCHLAAQPGVRYSVQRPFVVQKANDEGFLSVLEACRIAGVKRLVYASSSSVYGGNTKLPFSEDDAVDTPISLYAATKRANELMAHVYGHLHGLQTVGLRFFTVYGPWGRPDMAVWLFTEAMIQGRPITVFNKGMLKRDFTYIDDIVAGARAALFADGLPKSGIFNLGDNQAQTVKSLVEIIATELGVEPVCEFLPMQPGDVPATFADITRARATLGFEPRVPLHEGVPRFVRWYMDYYGLKKPDRTGMGRHGGS